MGDKWTSVDLPVLKAVDRLLDQHQQVDTSMLPSEAGVDLPTVERSIRRLYDGGYLTGIDATAQTDYFDLTNIRLLAPGLEAVGAWPADSYGALVEQIHGAIEREPDDGRRSRLRALLDGIVGAGRDVAVDVLSEWTKKASGL